MKNFIKRSLSTLVIFQFVTLIGLPQKPLNLNMYKLTLNDSTLKELTIEKTCNLLGRPTKVNRFMSTITVSYQDKGLEFTFKADGTQSIIISISIKIAGNWDEEAKEWDSVFSGKITPYVDSNMRTKNVLPLFTDYSPRLTSTMSEGRNLEYFDVTIDNCTVRYSFAPYVKYLDEIIIFYNTTF